ncbi:class I SAM-dependent methyltransferase [Bacillus carboniphilus]|uniref:Class I SAM-dependent methyltransferase n=2 Tax=Bacillus carboniphilus TaxID=86663 RepID=A0ABY9JYH6_9BACI|nr:class I SAM-dependent methyltransferase [Bacillus carboniphilus]WLR43398.1 class I SAM-dependent methyltransferase [Bacillus carboniphilus]
MKDFNIQSYLGIDSSEEALSLAKQKKPEWTFIKAGSIPVHQITPRDVVICFDVLIHQKRREDFG